MLEDFEMSLAILKRELEQSLEEESGQKKMKKFNSKSTNRHGMKKLKLKTKSKKRREAFSFKLAEDSNKDRTGKNKMQSTLEKLAMLDNIGASVSAARVLEDDLVKKRHKSLINNETSKKKEESKSILLTDEELAELEKEYFINSKSSKHKKKDNIWDD